jgi:putative DNA primase/helicase
MEGGECMSTSAFSENINTHRFEPGSLLNDIVTEDSAAFEFVECHGDVLRYCHDTGAWFKWNGVFWQKDETGIAFQWARKLARQLAENQDQRQRYIISKTSFAAGVEKFAKGDEKVAVTIKYWDSDPWLLGTPGGTVDLRTGELRKSRQEDGITKCTSVAPSSTGCPRWLKFLEEATGGDKEFVRFLQQWCGYSLSGSIREHALLFVYGPGGNGKSVFLNIVTAILDAYAVTAAMDTFTASNSDRHSTELAMLRGARLVTASETEEGRAWAENRIKQLTGGDPITARFMRQDNFTYKPEFKLTIVGNHKPILRNVDEANKRRINMGPFILKPEKPDRELEQKLLQEAPGILQWMIDGCLDWQRNGLIRPQVVLDATAEYFSEQDSIRQWIEECCDIQCTFSDTSSNLYKSWAAWAEANGEHAGSNKRFSPALERQGYTKSKTKKGACFSGIAVKPEVVTPPWSDADRS